MVIRIRMNSIIYGPESESGIHNLYCGFRIVNFLTIVSIFVFHSSKKNADMLTNIHHWFIEKSIDAKQRIFLSSLLIILISCSKTDIS